MLSFVMGKGFTLWLEISIAIWAILYRNTLILYIKELFGGYFGKPPKDTEEQDKDNK